MTKKIIITLTSLLIAFSAMATTLEQCLRLAKENYPLTKKYELIERTSELTVANIGKGWLPQITASAQVTLQNRVVALPEALTSMMETQGVAVKGLRKDQYRLGIDITQTVYDGGAIASGREVASRQAKVDAAANEVDLYAVRQRVSELYFGILLVDKRIELIEDLVELLMANEKKLSSMVKRGTAADSDFSNIKAERLSSEQRLTEMQSQRHLLLRLLSSFCGEEIGSVEMPDIPSSVGENNRPELSLVDARINLLNAVQRQNDSALRPRIALFASGYYGYPGYDMYHDMFSRNWTLNGIVGAKLTWNISAFYTRKNDNAKLNLQRMELENSRDVFLFNNKLEQISEDENITRYNNLLQTDREIVDLRSSVRKAAESKLVHGIIDINDLLREINDENAAKVQMSTHLIERLKLLWNKKLTLNN